MKNLVLVRHAKSSWGDPELDDFDRPLNDRGKRDAPRMAQFLKASAVVPEHIISSPAKRARKTAKIFAETLFNDASKVEFVDAVYAASTADLFAVVRAIDDRLESCMLVGHNPGLTDFANALVSNKRHAIDNIPTSGIVILKLDLPRWQLVDEGSGVLSRFVYPELLSV